MLYRSAKPAIRALLSLFFREIEVRGKPENNGPLIVFGNHPNMLLDALLIYVSVDRDMWFLGKSTLFKNSIVAKFLKAAHVLPVYRRSDSGDTSKNRETFAAASDTLRGHNALAIFPEGTSLGGRNILPFKTGIARIAVQALEESDGALPLQIQPVGITYSDPVTYRSSVVIQVGEVIDVREFISSVPEGSSVVQALTQACESRIKELTVSVAPHFEELFNKIAKLYGRVSQERPAEYEKMRTIAHNIESIAPIFPELAKQIEQKVDEVLKMDAPEYEPIPYEFYLLLPLILVGAAVFYYPYQVTGRIARSISGTSVELGSNKLVVGLGIFSLWIVFLFTICFMLLGFTPGVVVALSVVVCGFLTMRYLQPFENWVFSVLVPSKARRFYIAREQLIDELEKLRVDTGGESKR